MDKITVAGVIFAVLAAVFLFLMILKNPFPISGLTVQSGRFFNSSSSVGSEDSQFMWTNLSTSLAGQAFVIFAAAAGCLAMLRMEETKESQ